MPAISTRHLALAALLVLLALPRTANAAPESTLRYRAPAECPARAAAIQGIQFRGNPPGVRDGLLTIVKHETGYSVSMQTDLEGQVLTDAMTVDTCEGAVRWGVFVWNSLFHRPIEVEPKPVPANLASASLTAHTPTLSLGVGASVNPAEEFRPAAQAVLAGEFRWARLGIEGAYLKDRSVYNDQSQGATVSGYTFGAHLCGVIEEAPNHLRLGFCGNVKGNWADFKLDESPTPLRGFWADVGLSVLARVRLTENFALEGTVGGGWVPQKMKPDFPLGGIGYTVPETYSEVGLRLTVFWPMSSSGNPGPAISPGVVAQTPAVVVAQ